MKKLITKLSAVLLTASMAVPCFASAESVPTFYFSPHETDNVQVDSDGTVVISRETIAKEEGFTVGIDVFIDYDDPLCNWVSPKWKSSSPYIKLQNLVDPLADSSNPVPFTYSATDAYGKYISTNTSNDLQCNTMSFTCRNQNFSEENPSPVLSLQGEKSTDYALTTFDIFIDPNVPCGDYEIYFLTEPVDYADQHISEVYTRENGKVETIETRSLKIKVVCENIGDVNNDGFVDSMDASMILAAYSLSSVNEPHGLTDEQFTSADTNGDNIVDAVDASNVLAYYSYLSTTTDNPMSMCEYLNLSHCKMEIPKVFNSVNRFGEETEGTLLNMFRYDIDQNGQNELIVEYVDSNNYEFFNVYDNEEYVNSYTGRSDADIMLIHNGNNGEIYLACVGTESSESSTTKYIQSIYPSDNMIIEHIIEKDSSTGEVTSSYYNVDGNTVTAYANKFTYLSGEGGQQSLSYVFSK